MDSVEPWICPRCEEVIEDEPQGAICDYCYFLEHHGTDRMKRERERSSARRQLMQELGMPPDALYSTYTIPGSQYGPEWRGYQISMLGMLSGCSTFPPPWPYLQIGPILSQIWYRAVRVAQVPAFIEDRWHPDHGHHISMHGLEEVGRQSDIDRLTRGLRFLKVVDARGRPQGTGNYTEDEFAVTLRLAWAEVTERKGARPTQVELAAACALSASQFKVYLSKYKQAGGKYPPIYPD